MPFVIIVGTVVLFTIPYLALVALLLVALAALAGLAWAIVRAARALGRAIRRRLGGEAGRVEPTAPELSPAGSAGQMTRAPSV
jgi:hypothetical protein